jgi:hypothetical protein
MVRRSGVQGPYGAVPLQHLDLTNVGAHATGARALFGMLMLNQHLQTLVLDQNDILEGEEGPGLNPEAAHGVPAVIGEALAHNSSLTRLSLRSNKLNTRAVQTLVAGLEHNSSLTALQLQSNDVSMSLMVSWHHHRTPLRPGFCTEGAQQRT